MVAVNRPGLPCKSPTFPQIPGQVVASNQDGVVSNQSGGGGGRNYSVGGGEKNLRELCGKIRTLRKYCDDFCTAKRRLSREENIKNQRRVQSGGVLSRAANSAGWSAEATLPGKMTVLCQANTLRGRPGECKRGDQITI